MSVMSAVWVSQNFILMDYSTTSFPTYFSEFGAELSGSNGPFLRIDRFVGAPGGRIHRFLSQSMVLKRQSRSTKLVGRIDPLGHFS